MTGPIVGALEGNITNIQLEWWAVPVCVLFVLVVIAFAWWKAKND